MGNLKGNIMIIIKIIVILCVSILFSCSSKNEISDLKKYLNQCSKGEKYAKIDGLKLSKKAVRREYYAFISTTFPKRQWLKMFQNKKAMKAYGRKMAKEYLLVLSAFKTDLMKKTASRLMFNAAIRKAVADLYIRKKTNFDSLFFLKSYRKLNEKMIDSFYQKHKQEYIKNKITEKAAQDSLRFRLFNKRKKLVEKFIDLEKQRIVKLLKKTLEYDVP